MTLFTAHTLRKLTALCLMVTMLAGCDMWDDVTGWFTGEKEKKPLAGTRIAVLNEGSDIQVDDSLSGVSVTIPDATSGTDWPQAGGGFGGITGNLHISGLTHHDSAPIGDSNAWEQPLYPSPIVANGMVFAMDAKGYITAHSAKDIGKVIWTNKSLVTVDEDNVLGGGLAFDGGHIYATSGRGLVAELDALKGTEIWKKPLGAQLRAAPKVKEGKLYALSVDNQLFALDSEKGALLWSHRGINENADFLASIAPALSDSIVITPYSSGELHALDTVSGQDVWTDTLILPHRSSATSGFSGIGGNPIIKDNVVYATGSNGFAAAISLLSGRRIWEQNISSLNTPWIAGDFMYMLSNDWQLVCLNAADGRIKWVQPLPKFANVKKKKDPYTWRGPIMANGQLLVAGMHGQMLAFSPIDGKALATIEIPEDITDAPVVGEGRLYMLTQDARLHVLY